MLLTSRPPPVSTAHFCDITWCYLFQNYDVDKTVLLAHLLLSHLWNTAVPLGKELGQQGEGGARENCICNVPWTGQPATMLAFMCHKGTIRHIISGHSAFLIFPIFFHFWHPPPRILPDMFLAFCVYFFPQQVTCIHWKRYAFSIPFSFLKKWFRRALPEETHSIFRASCCWDSLHTQGRLP